MFDIILAKIKAMIQANYANSVSKGRIKDRIVDNVLELYVTRSSLSEDEVGAIMTELHNIALEVRSVDSNIEYDSKIIGKEYKIMFFYLK